jgi:hypothetical protein
MTSLMQSGTIADIVLAVMVVEGLLLWALRSRLKNFHAYDLIAMLAAGFFLVLALRAALTGAGWHWIALCLAGALVAHLLDLWRQLQPRL